MIIQVMTDNKSIEGGSDNALRIRISNASNNGISMTEDGMLIASKGNPGKAGAGGTMNTPGNSIDGNLSESISILRFNSTVSRRKLGDTPENEGVLMSTIVSNILGT